MLARRTAGRFVTASAKEIMRTNCTRKQRLNVAAVERSGRYWSGKQDWVISHGK